MLQIVEPGRRLVDGDEGDQVRVQSSQSHRCSAAEALADQADARLMDIRHREQVSHAMTRCEHYVS